MAFRWLVCGCDIDRTIANLSGPPARPAGARKSGPGDRRVDRLELAPDALGASGFMSNVSMWLSPPRQEDQDHRPGRDGRGTLGLRGPHPEPRARAASSPGRPSPRNPENPTWRNSRRAIPKRWRWLAAGSVILDPHALDNDEPTPRLTCKFNRRSRYRRSRAGTRGERRDRRARTSAPEAAIDPFDGIVVAGGDAEESIDRGLEDVEGTGLKEAEPDLEPGVGPGRKRRRVVKWTGRAAITTASTHSTPGPPANRNQTS